MKNYPQELAELEERYAALEQAHKECKAQARELQAKNSDLEQQLAAGSRHNIRVTLKSGVTRYYDADKHAILPSKTDPQVVEFRKHDPTTHTFRVVASARWSEVAEVHNQSA